LTEVADECGRLCQLNCRSRQPENGHSQVTHYRALTARATAAWPLADNGMRLLVGGEIGRAERRVAGRSPAAWQTEIDIEGSDRRHSSGIVLGSAGGSWLTSSDFRENDRLFEWRYLWRLRADVSLDAHGKAFVTRPKAGRTGYRQSR
jgi:hypothetical protein